MLEMIKQILIKYVSQLFLILTILGLAYFGYTMYKNKKDLEGKYQSLVGQQQDYNQINKQVADLQRKYVDEKTLREQEEKEWADQKQALEGRLQMLTDAQFSDSATDHTTQQADYIDPNGKFKLYEAGDPAYCLFRLNQDGTSVAHVYTYSLHVSTAISQDPASGKYNVLTKASRVLTEPDIKEKYEGKVGAKGIEYPLNIDGGTAMINPVVPSDNRESAFYWLAPHVNVGLNFGVNDSKLYVRPSLDISVSGYGKSSNDLKWKLLDLGISSNNDLSQGDLHLMPFLYRPFDSFITNTYIGPGIGTGTQGRSFFIGISLGL